ncbi:MAG: Rrf2 family transcriptional regulator [Arhodomonas sp.]|nr:Rrf2 family transcriptional regulator [Arhodomonas sp.]
MRLTLYTDYSLRVLIYLGIKEDRFATISEIASRYDISRNHIMKVVYGLAQGEYIRTVRGKKGGMYLQRAPESINIGTLIRHTEQDLTLVECFAPDNRCAITHGCELKRILGDALQAFFAELDRYTLADLLTTGDAMRQLLGLDGVPVQWAEKRQARQG